MKFFRFVVGFSVVGLLWTTSALATNDALRSEIETLWSAGKHSQAYHALDKWMSQDKQSPWPWVEAGSLRFRERRYGKALSYLKTALDKSPSCAEAYYWRGRTYEEQKKPLEAANEYRAALLADEKYQDAQDALSRVLTQLGSSEK